MNQIEDFNDSESEDEQELLFAKKDLLIKLGNLADRGIKLKNYYDLDSNYEEMKIEYEIAIVKAKYDIMESFNKIMMSVAIPCHHIRIWNEVMGSKDLEINIDVEELNMDVEEINIEDIKIHVEI